MKRSFKRSAHDLSRRGLCLLLTLLLLLSQLPVASAAVLSETELSLITGAGLPAESVETAETSAAAEAEAAILPLDEPALPPADTAEQPLAVEAAAPEENALIAEAGQLEDGVETAEIPAVDKQPPAADETPPIPDPAADLLPVGAEESIETAKPIADGMVLQSTAYSCGPAALATLIKMLGGQNYYEQIMQMVTLDERGSNLLALRHSALALGYQTQGWRLALPDLAGAGPLLAHTVIGGEQHFTVVLSVDKHFAYLADPTLGYIAMPLEEFALTFSGAVLKVSPSESTSPAAGDVATVSEEIMTEADPASEAAVGEEVVAEPPVTGQDPVADDPLTNQPAIEPVQDALPVQPVVEVPAENDAVPVVDEIVEEAPVTEPVEDTLLDQEVAAPVAAEALVGYHGNEPADTHSLTEETSLALASAATVLDDAEMENIFGCGRGGRRIPTRNGQPASVPVNRQTASGGGGGTTITWQRAGTTAGVGTMSGTTLGMAGKWAGAKAGAKIGGTVGALLGPAGLILGATTGSALGAIAGWGFSNWMGW